MTILTDAGYWIALFDRDDRHHERAIRATNSLREQLLVTWPVLAESARLLGMRLGPQAVQQLLELGERGAYRIHEIAEHDLPLLLALMKQYAHVPMDLADASLVLLAEQTGDARILSTEMPKAGIHRFAQNKPFHNLMFAAE